MKIKWDDWSDAREVEEVDRNAFAAMLSNHATPVVNPDFWMTGDALVIRISPTEIADCKLLRLGRIEEV